MLESSFTDIFTFTLLYVEPVVVRYLLLVMHCCNELLFLVTIAVIRPSYFFKPELYIVTVQGDGKQDRKGDEIIRSRNHKILAQVCIGIYRFTKIPRLSCFRHLHTCIHARCSLSNPRFLLYSLYLCLKHACNTSTCELLLFLTFFNCYLKCHNGCHLATTGSALWWSRGTPPKGVPPPGPELLC